MRPRQNGRHFADDAFTRIFLNENIRISIKISLKYVSYGPVHKIPALVRLVSAKPLSEPMMIRLPSYKCVTWPQWVNRVPTPSGRWNSWTFPGLFQDFSRTLFFHIMPLMDDDAQGKYDTRIGEIIWHGHHKAVSKYINQEQCINTCVRLEMMDISIKIYRNGYKYIYMYIYIYFYHLE